ncbi:hypothetical protein H6P81_002541 [Aristolochia fimbriata]|uniref:Sn1-specific diacylglycerol lipase alpha n=1 Tax=Aristolochia fimbriata TaxID=158543 RepID=A0AAV7FAA2_ARIFI|nr:hypothetical protein H6P81_002541 [Aristolochia fimbriata]
MATATMATAAGAAALLYYTLNRKLQSTLTQEGGESGDESLSTSSQSRRILVTRGPAQAPATWLETISTLSETLRFTYSETLGKWPIGELAFGINFLLKRQGNLQVASIYAGENSIQLKGAEIIGELKHLLTLLTLCWHFSKKPFPLFLEETGYCEEDVLLQEPKAGILKPAFTILIDKRLKSFLLLIRGTHSIRDTLTAATGAVVPFHHSVVHEGGVSDLVLGYAHCGMVAAARWIAKHATPHLIEALHKYPDYKIKIVGHSLGGGTAAILTYVLREHPEFSNATCVTFAPAACMTWELAESGVSFITSVINGADLVPTFSAASVDDLRSEVTASAWLNDLRNQIEQTRILSTVYRSASALGSRLPSMASARAKVAGAGALLRPVSNGTQVVMQRARCVAQAALNRPSLGLSSWSCMGPRDRKNTVNSTSENTEKLTGPSTVMTEASESLMTVSTSIETEEAQISDRSEGLSWISELRYSSDHASQFRGDAHEDDVDGDEFDCPAGNEDDMTEYELWQQLQHEIYRQTEDDVNDTEKEIREEEKEAAAEMGGTTASSSTPETDESRRFFPPGKLMHIVTLDSELSETDGSELFVDEETQPATPKVGIFLTPRVLYGKLRLSQTMVSDHFMPVYRREIERLISDLEKEVSSLGERSNDRSEF